MDSVDSVDSFLDKLLAENHVIGKKRCTVWTVEAYFPVKRFTPARMIWLTGKRHHNYSPSTLGHFYQH